MVKNMAFTWVGDVIVLVHNENPPDDDVWRAYVESLTSRDLKKVRAVAYTDGGAPTAAQRRALTEATAGVAGLSVVISASTIVRGVVTALSWFNPMIKAFSPSAREEAFKHLKLTESEAVQVVRAIERLRVELKGGPKA